MESDLSQDETSRGSKERAPSRWAAGGALAVMGCVALMVGVVTLHGSNSSSHYGSSTTSMLSSSRELTEQRFLSQEPGYKKHPHVLSDVYIPRGKPLDGVEKQRLKKKWGAWDFVDAKASERPGDELYDKYPNRDVPAADFPDTAWQRDADYLKDWLPAAQALVRRSMDAILAEYGHGPLDEPDKTFEERSKMFQLTVLANATAPLPGREPENGGATTARSFDGLVRRVLHSIMTQDTFVVAVSGHSSAAGHGNLFQQAYMPQVQKVLEPIFARLGVHCFTRNIAYGGAGTVQSSLGSGSILGSDLDMLVWDSGMTEAPGFQGEVFIRQALIGGNKVPVLWGGHAKHLNLYKDHADADVGMYGSAREGMPTSEDLVQTETLPWATRYLKCSNAMRNSCRSLGYIGQCWRDRTDYTPVTEQQAITGGRAKWHPGNRYHQLSGRNLAFTVLMAAEEGLKRWGAAEKFILPDEAWHVTAHYKNIVDKVKAMPKDIGTCYSPNLPDRICNTPLKGVTEWTPRANPGQTSIRSIAKNGVQLGLGRKNEYDPPDLRNPDLEVPDGVLDILNVIENGKEYLPLPSRKKWALENAKPPALSDSSSFASNDIRPGKGWMLNAPAAPDNCDGTYDAFCARDNATRCLLYGHNDFRGAYFFDGLSGWIVLNLKDVVHGIIMVKMEDMEHPRYNKVTDGWTCENNAASCDKERRDLSASNNDDDHHLHHRQLAKKQKPEPIPRCEDYTFEFAIDGKVTSWKHEQFRERLITAQRIVKIWTLLDDENFTGGVARDVELAIRLKDCARDKTISLSHVYWA